jgi:hypothetical protein
VEMADIVRYAGQAFVERSRRWINGQHEKVLAAITRCRTAALGGHRDQCSGCGHTTISYNSCRNRHCPRCQGNARVRWLQQRERELLPTRYVHAVFTMPRELAPLALQNKQVIYSLLFRASAATLLEVARDPRHLGAEIGFFSVLHTWNQRLQHHPHVHCVIAAGGLAPDHTSWISSRRTFFLPVKVLGRVFRGKFIAGLKTAFREGKLECHGHLAPLAEPRSFARWLRVLFRHDWVVYSKRPFGGPEHALRYLGAYTHRVGISNSRLVSFVGGRVSFRWRDSAHGNRKRVMSLPADEFLRRFLLHLLPRGFVRSGLRRKASSDSTQMPTLQRDHARRRAALFAPTPSALPTAAGNSRRMNTQLQQRTQPCHSMPAPAAPTVASALSSRSRTHLVQSREAPKTRFSARSARLDCSCTAEIPRQAS